MDLAFCFPPSVRWMAIVLAGFIAQQPAFADDLPSCSAQHFDADGDGFGWENEATCRVTDATAPAPVHTNRELNATVDLIRPYWDGNHDIANREIQCDHYIFDAAQDKYRARETNYDGSWGPTYPSETFVHKPIPSVPPYLGFMPDPIARNDPTWTIIDGLYYGSSMLAHPYVELVETDNAAKAIRLWFNANSKAPMELAFSSEDLDEEGYYECRDVSGTDFSPTGRLGQATQSPSELVDLTLSVIPNTEQQNPDLIINLVTSEPVKLQKAYWNYNRDLAQRSIYCNFFDYQLRPDNEQYYSDPHNGRILILPYLFTDSGNDITYWKTSSLLGGRQGSRTLYFIDDVVLQPVHSSYGLNPGNFFASEYVEISESGARAWISSKQYVECSVAPTGSEL